MTKPGNKEHANTIVLFDVDGTLTQSRQDITPVMEQFLKELNQKVDIGLVGGSDLPKIAEQMTATSDSNQLGTTNGDFDSIDRIVKQYKYVFAENGLIAYQDGELLSSKSIITELGEERIQRFLNFVLGYLSKITIPLKRGNFIEFRNGMINVSPIGRSCTLRERLEFNEYDSIHRIRERMVEDLHKEFDQTDLRMDYVIGGQISIDCFPKGWDKRFCLQYVDEGQYEKIYFFGDKTEPGGNDHAIYNDSRTIGYSVTDPQHTKQILMNLFFSNKHN